MEGLLGAVAGWALVAVLLAFLVTTFWLEMSQARTKGARQRLRRPRPEEVRRIVGYSPPPDLVRFYLESPLVERLEFDLVDSSKTPPVVWPIADFNPLTGVDVKEWRSTSGVKDIPIASDPDKGIYYVTREGRVMLLSPNVPGGTVEVASTIRAFAAFRPTSGSPDDE